ncbi:MAG: hypothetical protein AAF800_09980 [Planctomycetota bacterium]
MTTRGSWFQEGVSRFAAAATLPEPDHTGRLEPWAVERLGLIQGARDRAEVLEKARCYHRLRLAYGTPTPRRSPTCRTRSGAAVRWRFAEVVGGDGGLTFSG